MAHANGVRRHHNNTGFRQIKRGKPARQMKALAKRLGIPYGLPDLSRTVTSGWTPDELAYPKRGTD